MVAALGVNQKWLFTSVFALGIFLAALGGALELPRESVNHTMDLQIITEVLVVVVIGGLGNVLGTFLAAIIVSELNAFGILIFPKISIVLVFLVMALVLILRPWGLLGRAESGGAPGERPVAGALAPARYARKAARCARRRGGGCAAAHVRQLWPQRCDRSSHLHALCREPTCAGRRRRPGLVWTRRLFRPRRLWRGARAEAAPSADGGRARRRACAWSRWRAGLRLVLRAALRRLFRHADPRLRPDRLVDRFSMDGSHRWRQRPRRRLAERLGGERGAFLLADAGAGRRGDRPSAHDCLFALRLRVASFARQRIARRGDRTLAPSDPMARLRPGRRLRRPGRRAFRFPEGECLSRQSRHSAFDRRTGHGSARRRRRRVGRGDRRGSLQVAVDLDHQPHRLFQARARPADRRPGRALSTRRIRRL